MSPTGGKRNNDEAEGAGDNSDIHNISDELVIDVKMEEEYESDDQNCKTSIWFYLNYVTAYVCYDRT